MARITENKLEKLLDKKFPRNGLNRRRVMFIMTNFADHDGKVNEECLDQYLEMFKTGSIDRMLVAVAANAPTARPMEGVGTDATWWQP